MSFFKSIMCKAYLNIMFMDYVYNINTEKNLDLLKNEIIVLIDKHKREKTIFKLNSLKTFLCIKINHYDYMYQKYSNYFEDFKLVLNIKNNDTFVQDFKTKINGCDDLFVLYLFSIILKEYEK